MTQKHQLIDLGHRQHRIGRAILRGGTIARNVGVAAGSGYVASKYLASGGKYGRSLAHNLWFNSTGIPLRFMKPGTRKIPQGIANLTGPRIAGGLQAASTFGGKIVHGLGQAITAPIRLPVNAADRLASRVAYNVAQNPARKEAALRAVQFARRLKIGQWAPAAIGLGTLAMVAGQYMKHRGTKNIQKGFAAA